MRFRMKVGRILRRIRRAWQACRRETKIKIYLAVICLVIGGIFGNMIGQAVADKRAKKTLQKEVTEIEKAKNLEVEGLKQTVENLQTQLQKEQNGPTVVDLPWYLTLVNEDYPMQKDYVPKLTEVEDGYRVDSRIADALRKMLADAQEEGLHIVMCSAYRSVQRQEQVFNESMQERLDRGMNYWEAYQDNAKSVAIPGTSEHGLGLAVDLISNQYTKLDSKQAKTKEAKWLKANCHKYGFILRYPPDKTEETGIIYEPWHYRYVGVDDATKIMEQGVTLETYLQEYQ